MRHAPENVHDSPSNSGEGVETKQAEVAEEAEDEEKVK
jgi:hypothetical protein